MKLEIRSIHISIITVGLLIFYSSCAPVQHGWKAAKGPLMTQWAKDVSPQNVHPEYPRPQMVREDWMNLNGLWQYAIRPGNLPKPKKFTGQILVPFPAESALSGVMKEVGKNNRLWYRRAFEIPPGWKDKRILLHFGAVDWEAAVWVNDKLVGIHRGGYDPFSFDITDLLNPSRTQEIVLSVWDPADAGFQPRGKQVAKPNSIWYTSVTGIWQTVWLEPVNRAHIESLNIVPDIDKESVYLTANCSKGAESSSIEIEIGDSGSSAAKTSGRPGEKITIHIKQPKLWSPDSPFLYDLKVTLIDDEGVAQDSVNGYFGMRKIAVAKDANGVNRLCLNNEPAFLFGPLDQGWWPDGLYAAPTDEALRYDIEVTKKLGFNMARKHVKVEPQRWYYWCDKLGLLVWQDMPNGDKHIGQKDPDLVRSRDSAVQFELELANIIDSLRNHPCIVMWVPFNEGWGQYDTAHIAGWIKKHDPTRLVNNASGWVDRNEGDVCDIHSYPGPAAPPNEPNRAAVLGEFGGLGLHVREHSWQKTKGWGYRMPKTREQLSAAYGNLLQRLQPMKNKGLAAAVYTQTTDVETEVNGLMSYDRAVIKMDAEKTAALNHRLYETDKTK